MRVRTLALSLPLVAVGFALAPTAAQSAAPDAQRPHPTAPLAVVSQAFDCANAEPLAFDALLDRLANYDVVFLGETHIDDVTHRLEHAVLEGLLARRHDKLVLSMEMFERDVQPAIDDYLQGRIDEAAFLHRSRPWGNYEVDYRPLVETAKAAAIPVVAANFPAALRRKLGMGGKQAFEALSPEERALMPAQLLPASDAYWQRVDRAVRGHMGGGGGGTAEERLYDGQNLWDNSMGDSVAKALAAHPGSAVLHVAGGFHVAWRDGTVAQFRHRSKDSKVAVVMLGVVPRLQKARPDLDKEQADYLLYAESLARSEDDDTFAVSVPRELRYRAHVPPGRGPWPLLIWLPDRDVRTQDAFEYWQAVLGEQCAIAVVEHPVTQLQDDLAPGGRYVFGDGFRADYASVAHGVEAIAEYAARRLCVDPARVVVAGEGDGGAVVLWTALYGQWLSSAMLAVDPGDLTRLSMEGLPDQRPVVGSLQLAGHRVAQERLQKVAGDYAQVGAAAEVVPFDGSAAALSQLVRQRLGVTAAAAPAGAALQLVLDQELPRARQWAELLAAKSAAAGRAAVVVAPGASPTGDAALVRRLRIGQDGTWPVAAFASGEGLPLAGGPFGGTTVVVLPAGTSDADRAAWQELEQKKAIKRRSMFANLAIAGPGIATLPEIMAQLKARGRSRVLIVPAVFCADAAAMQHLKEELGDAAAGMDLSWLPGFGASVSLP